MILVMESYLLHYLTKNLFILRWVWVILPFRDGTNTMHTV